MIVADQPMIFPEHVRAAVSSVEDGSMKDGVELMTPEAERARAQFLSRLDMPHERAAVFYAAFDTDDYCVYRRAQAGLMPGIDGVSTNEIGRPILLPIADCVGVILYDPAHRALMVSHLGRHSTEQYGGIKSVEHMTMQYASDPADLRIWLGPSPNATDYPLWAFGDRGFVDVLREQFYAAGISPDHLEVSDVDTVSNQNYFSHSQFLAGRQAVDGRYAIAAMLR